jgi:hypothetical protein
VVRVRRHDEARLKAELEHLQLKSGCVLLFRLQENAEVVAVGGEYLDRDAETAYVV